MPLPRRFAFLIAVATCSLLLFFLLHRSNYKETWRELPQNVGMGEIVEGVPKQPPKDSPPYESSTHFEPELPKPPGSNYTRRLIVPHTKKEDISWIAELLPDLDTAIYEVDNPHAQYHPPRNKGHEAMAYLTYIIDHYDALPNISIFMHAHRFTWHNNDLLLGDAAEMLARLSSPHVARLGYMNLRCHWDPGCPDWIHPGAAERDELKQEQVLMAQAWAELFPRDPIPPVLAQPCCSQFALSAARVRALPRSRYVWFRDWLLRTPLSDSMSGRVWEYLWQFVFTGSNVACPAMHVCYCDGYGVCFGSEEAFNEVFELRYELRECESKLQEWEAKDKALEEAKKKGELDEATRLEVPPLGEDVWLREKIEGLKVELERRRTEAIQRGIDPRNRALEAGREWKEGDGF